MKCLYHQEHQYFILTIVIIIILHESEREIFSYSNTHADNTQHALHLYVER